MFLHDLFESTTLTRTLYRGDSTKIGAFSTEKTRNSVGLLFGMGIYLTDNPEVALDYTVKGGYSRDGRGTVVVRSADSQQDAIRLYLNTIMARDLGWIDVREELKTAWQNKWFEMHRGSRPYNGYNEEPSPEFLAYEAERQSFQDDFKKALQAEMSKYLKQAKAIYKKENLKVFRDTTGEWSIVRPDHDGTITSFEIPESYLRSTLHGDQPLTDHELEVVRQHIFSIVPSGKIDLRNQHNGMVSDWYEWIKIFRKEGTRYAWNDVHVGGKGLNPSLDEIWNGTHAGMSVFTNHIDAFIKHLRANGYNGIEYDGGKRLGANLRGGGGVRHQSFVLWDDEYVNSRRVETSAAKYADPDVSLGSINSTSLSRKWIEPDKYGNFYYD